MLYKLSATKSSYNIFGLQQSFNDRLTFLEMCGLTQNFLKSTAQLAQIQSAKIEALLLYSVYIVCWQQKLTMSLQCIEQAMQAKPPLIVISMLLGIRGAVLTKMQKHSESLQALKESLNIAFTSVSQKQQTYFLSFFPFCMSKVIELCNFNHGRREFLHLLDKIRIESSKYQALNLLKVTCQKKGNEIRQLMRLKGKVLEQDYKGQQTWAQKAKEPTSNIYINRLYTQRRQNLAQRQNSSRKNWAIDPYQLTTTDRLKQQNECLFM